MTGNISDSTATTERTVLSVPLEPARLREHEDIAYDERTYVHDDETHCAADAAGRAVVGVTNGYGEVLLLVAGEHAILPNCTVDADEDWASVARETAAETAGGPIALERVWAARRVEHCVEGADVPHNVTFQVVLEASPDGETAPTVEDDDWTAGWFNEIPVPVDSKDGHGDAVADIRRFL
ncbi:hypothetical protein BRD14_06955 [Halobacteriales archaeon SW_5_68_122]|nr:MAG: hypothetical protein BRD14_06955 [Halobacteriales archaeon SW_5_68_122]